MKKFIYIVFFILVAIGLYQNIDRLESIQDETLNVWVSSEEYDVLKELNPIFEQEYDVKIEMRIMSSEQVVSNLPLYVGTPDYPEIVTLSHTLISELVEMNALSPISDVFETLNILPTVKSGFKYKGEYYGVPYNAHTDILFYNKAKFPDGISSFNQLEQYDNISLVIEYQDIYHITPFVTGFGGYTVGINNFGDTNFYDIGLNKEESVIGLATMLQLLNKDNLYSNEGDVYKSFINYKSDLMIAPSTFVTSLSGIYSDLGYQAIPNFIEDVLPYTYMRIDTYQLTKYCENKQLAIEYLKFLLTDEVAAARYEQNRSIAPVDYEVPISQDEYYSVVKKQLHRAYPLPNQVEFNYLYLPYQSAAKKLVTMPDQIQSVLDATVREINEQIENVLK